MSDIVKRLDIKAGVMEMGERIAWGSDTALMREAARRIEELRAENQRLREAANRVLYALLPGKVVHMGHEHVRYSATYSVVGWNPILSLAALLGGGDE